MKLTNAWRSYKVLRCSQISCTDIFLDADELRRSWMNIIWKWAFTPTKDKYIALSDVHIKWSLVKRNQTTPLKVNTCSWMEIKKGFELLWTQIDYVCTVINALLYVCIYQHVCLSGPNFGQYKVYCIVFFVMIAIIPSFEIQLRSSL